MCENAGARANCATTESVGSRRRINIAAKAALTTHGFISRPRNLFSHSLGPKRTTRAAGTLKLWSTASRTVWRWFQRGRNRYPLNQLSDRMLADIGFDSHNLAAQVNRGLNSQREARRQEARIYRELMAYTDAELDDIHVKRVDIPAIAHGDYPFEVEVANPVTTAARPAPPAANDRYQVAAA